MKVEKLANLISNFDSIGLLVASIRAAGEKN